MCYKPYRLSDLMKENEHSVYCKAYMARFLMVALRNMADHIYFHAVVCSSFFFLFLLAAEIG